MDDINGFDNGLTPGPSPKEGGANASPGYMTVDSLKAKELIQLGKDNRKEATQSETILWRYLRNRKLGEKFRRQHAIGSYIPDFVCLEKRLIVEVDGGYHNSPEQIELDGNRTFELEQKHLFKVIRFTNEEVSKDINTVLEKIKTVLSERK
jgi:very-short-patch-repair endonuclease